jgi:oligopeptide transport system ATP-binding protein
MSEIYLETRGIKKYFPVTKGFLRSKVSGWLKAVDAVDLSIRSGETMGLVGESGCGKTTLSRLILLLEKLTDGSILFKGKDLKEFNREDFLQYRKCVQAVFQNPYSSLNPRMRVGNIISEPIPIYETHDKKEIEHRISSALQAVGLDPGDANKFPHEFSGGQRQRIAIARALVSNPYLIVLDEPISSQDVSIRAQIMNLLKELQSRMGISYLFIAHDLAAVRYMSHVISVMYLGKIVEQAPGDDLCTNPLHPYTNALFLASLPDDPDSKSTKDILTGEVPSPINPPSGCRFHTRCSNAMKKCSEIDPSLKEASPGHFVSCLLYG